MTITKRITIDLQQPGSRQIIKAKQGDANSRIVQIALYAGGVAWTPDGTDPTGVVQYRKPDGTGGAYDRLPGSTTKAVTISGNQLTVTLAPQVLTAAGLVYCQVQLLSGATILTTFCWLVDVEADVLSGAVSEDYYNVATLDGLSNRINDLSTQLASAQAAITTAQLAAQSAKSTATAAKTKADAALPRSGGTMTGDLDMGSHDIKLQDAALRADPYQYPEGDGHRVMVYNPLVDGPGEMEVADPTNDDSAANKGYVDNQVAGRVKTVNGQAPDANGNVVVETGGGTGDVQTVNSKAPDAAGNVDLTAADVGALPITGGDITGNLNISQTLSANDVAASRYLRVNNASGFADIMLQSASASFDPVLFLSATIGVKPRIVNVGTPKTDDDAVNKGYVDNLVGDVESLLAAI